MYFQIINAEHRSIVFAQNGTFLSTTDTSGQVNGCLNKTLQQLIANGQTYSFLNTSDLSKFITEYQKSIADIGLLTDKLKIADQQVQ